MLTLDDVAKELKVSKRSVRRLIIDNKLKTVRVGHLVRITEADFELFKRNLK